MLKNLFGDGSFLDKDLEQWTLETWAYFQRNLGGSIDAPLVRADATFFPPMHAKGHEKAAYLFERVKSLMNMQDRRCVLQVKERPPPGAQVGEFWHLQSRGASGTFQVREGEAVVSYAADLVNQPRQLIAVFAHELCHYRLAGMMEMAPGGQEAHELTTELAVAYSGFGLFGANAAFSFSQHGDAFSQGWQSQRNGYFSERTWAFAIALFLNLKGMSPDEVRQDLKSNIADLVRGAHKHLTRHSELTASLRQAA